MGKLEMQNSDLQFELESNADVRVVRAAEARRAAEVRERLLQRNAMLDQALQLSLNASMRKERRLSDLQAKETAAWSHGRYLASREDGNKEDKCAMRFELQRLEDEEIKETHVKEQLSQRRARALHDIDRLRKEHEEVKEEICRLRKEDML